MRVIHIIHGKCNPNGHNGISRVVYFLNKYEKLNGVNSEIWAVVDDTKHHFTLKRDDFVSVECFPRVKVMFGNQELLSELEKQSNSIDLVHFHMIWFYDKNIILKKLKKLDVPYIITTHGTYSMPNPGLKKFIAKKAYELEYLNNASEVHILTREEGTGLHKYGYLGKCFVGYNGIEFSEIPSDYNKHFFDEKKYKDRIKIGWVGVLRNDKNIDSLIRAVSMLPSKYRDELEIILVGPDKDKHAAKYLNLANELGCSESIDWLGPLYNQEKYDAYYNFDAYVMPSFSEGFSMAILDAMACSKPLLLTKGCNMNYFNNNDRDFFVMCEPYPQDICNGLMELIDRKDEWDTMGKHARLWVDEEFNWDAIAKKMIKDYERIIKTRE